MGCWGMGLTQSDEFCEYYEEFIERYKNGEAPKDIAASMLEEYAGLVADFGEGILHDVYFAIAKGQWMCGALEPYIIKKVTAIIDSGDNIEWYRSLDAD